MPSIFEGCNPDDDETKRLADAVVASVFMGLVKERTEARLQVFIGYGGGYDGYREGGGAVDPKDVKPLDVELHDRLRAALARVFDRDLLVIGAANRWVDGSKRDQPSDVSTTSYVITGARSEKQIHKAMSLKAKSLALDCLRSNRYEFGTEASPTADDERENKERGAYYGIADLANGEVYGPVSTTRHFYRTETGRWMNPRNGWIRVKDPVTKEESIASGSHARMSGAATEKLLSRFGAPEGDYVVGYCHGMIFAEHICELSGGGTAYEISMNKATCKNASCFGCSTFMFANGMPPSWMHVGSAESWAPLPTRAKDFGYGVHFNADRLVETAVTMNRRWAEGVARWMRAGVRYATASPKRGALESVMGGKADGVLAYWFLDALTLHGVEDVQRILGAIGG